MKLTALVVLSALSAVSGSTGAETVFRCTENGKTKFTGKATGNACQPLDIKAVQPNSGDLSRRQQELEEWNRQREERVQQSIAQEAATEAQRRRAQLADVSRGEPRLSRHSNEISLRHRRRARGEADRP